MARLDASIRRAADLGASEIAAMYALYERYYGGCDEATFRADLAGKSDVIWLTEAGRLRGFSTLALQRLAIGGCDARSIFSGDTIIDHDCWGEQALARAFCRFAGRLKAEQPHEVLYWFLISKGHRTYRYLNAFARIYYPHPDIPTPPDMQAVMDVLARARFGEAYLSDRGIVRFEPVRGYLRAPWNGVRSALMSRRDVQLFLQRNAGHAEGDELVCIAELSEANLRTVARREFLDAYDDARREFAL